ncbi:MAG: RloB domain-containing protein [Lentisphaerae bacterium]|jgi:hypothetical protein|nr:RloB domain-containing protein [Lentisphaerota bacterium]
MTGKRRKFDRRLGQLRYRKLFIIATEGVKTEPQYFERFSGSNSVVRVHCLKGKHDSAPPHVLKRMKEHLDREGLKPSDKFPWEAWLVVDKDQWTEEQLAQLHKWTKGADIYKFALSNPSFEYWLLLHFEDGKGVANSQQCTTRLKQYLPDYDKGIDIRKITQEMIDDAVERAKARDNPPCQDWPRKPGSTVYKLVESIQKA